MTPIHQLLTSLTALVMTLSAQVGNLGQSINPNTQLAQVAPTSVTVRVVATSDDGTDFNGSWRTSFGSGASANNRLGSFAGIASNVGWRFTGLNISGTVNSAYITVRKINYDSAGTVASTIYGWKTSDAGQFDSSNRPSTVTKTTASVPWSFSNTAQLGSTFNTPDISPIIQEIVDSYGLSNGSVNIFALGSANGNIDSHLEDYQNTGTNEAVLTITYTPSDSTPPPPPPTPTNGQCSTTINTCSTGTFSDITDTSTNYLWQCNGSNGGTNASCSLPIPPTPPPPTPDTTAPSIPTGLSATAVSSSQINLSWTASIDDVAVTGYDVYRNGSLLTSTSNTNYNDTGLSPSTSYSYTVRSKDVASNTSSQSSSVSATTQAVPPPPPSGTYPWSSFIDSSRAVDWRGVGSTIPNYTTNCAIQPTLIPNDPTAAATNRTAIQNALASCTSTRNVVNIPAGNYYVAGFNFGSQGNQVLRGAGSSAPGNVCAAGSTCLRFTSSTGCSGLPAGVCMMPSNLTYAGNTTVLPPNGTRQCSWTAGYAQGTTVITLNNCPGGAPSVNQMLILDQANDLTDNGGIFSCDSFTSSQPGGSNCTVNDGFPTNADGRRIGGYTHSQKQIVTVQSVSGSGAGPYTVTISPGIYFNNIRSSQNPGAWWAGTVVNDGLENIYIDGSSLDLYNIQIAGCQGCWMKGVTSYNAGRAHVLTTVSSRSVIRDSYFVKSKSSAATSYGVEFESTSADLMENNICQQLTACLMLGNTSGSVIGYNFSVGGVYINTNYLQSSYASHNAGNNMNLLEGNNLMNIATDDTWGSSHQQTYFRNFLTAWQKQLSGPFYNTSSLIMRSYSRAHNVLGNILGQPGYHNTYESYATSPSGGVNQNSLSRSIFSLGWTGSAETTVGTCGTPGCDSLVRFTLMRWGNYDTVTGSTRWNSTEASPSAVPYVNSNFTPSYFSSLSQTLPASLYYNSRPSWWPSSKQWPPIGPDVSGGNLGICTGTYSGAQATNASQCSGGTLTSAWSGRANSIPAQDCYLNVMGGRPDGTGNVLSFDANACYYGGSSTPPPPTTYTITSSAGTGGTISPSGTITLNSGSSQTFTFTPNTGYRVSNVIVNGNSYGSVSSYTFNNITSNQSISVSFSLVTPIVGDFNSDGLVNSIDLSLMISSWNTSNSTYDLNRDGLVNSLDYTIMVQNWSV